MNMNFLKLFATEFDSKKLQGKSYKDKREKMKFGKSG